MAGVQEEQEVQEEHGVVGVEELLLLELLHLRLEAEEKEVEEEEEESMERQSSEGRTACRGLN